jgi:hypothetical protein
MVLNYGPAVPQRSPNILQYKTLIPFYGPILPSIIIISETLITTFWEHLHINISTPTCGYLYPCCICRRFSHVKLWLPDVDLAIPPGATILTNLNLHELWILYIMALSFQDRLKDLSYISQRWTWLLLWNHPYPRNYKWSETL